MWVLRILNGSQSGQIFPLHDGSQIIGREPHCDIVFNHPGISKQHAQIEIFDDKIILSDLNSRNGTFINGIKVQSIRLQGSEKIALYEIFFELLEMSPEKLEQLNSYLKTSPPPIENLANFPQTDESPSLADTPPLNNPVKPTILQLIQKYIDEVVLPGTYKLPELMEFRWVLACFMGLFILFVTSLSAIPLMRILKYSIERESQRRALTIARTLAKINRSPLMQGLDSAVSVEIASREPGVEKALIISNLEGHIIAPASQAGQVPDLPFIHEARREGKEIVKQIDDNTIGALVPIEFYNPETGSQAATACAAVIYNMGSLAVDDSRTLSLFIQTFFIAIIVGSILFFFLLKVIEFPLYSLNKQLDIALKENQNELSTSYRFPVLQQLISNINSTLSRLQDSQPQQGAASPTRYDRSGELHNVVQLMGFGSIGVTAHDNTIQSINEEFTHQTGIATHELQFQPIEKITDQALRLSIMDLIERARQEPHALATNELELHGQLFEIAIQAVYGTQQVAYYLITFLPQNQGGEPI